MKNLLFFDIDGTLAYPRGIPTPETVSAIRQARKNGHRAFICTGGIVILGKPVPAQLFMNNQFRLHCFW